MITKNILISMLIILVLTLMIGNIFMFTVKERATEKIIENKKPIRIGIINYPGFAPFYIAEEKGFFENQGVNAEVVLISDPNQAISLLESNDVQMLFSSADFTPIVKDAGVDVKEIFASDIGYGSDGLLVKNDVNSIEDLKGKTIYLGKGYPSHFLFRFLTEQAGFENGDVTIVDMGADQVGAAFFSKQIDYGMSWEPWLSKASERKDGRLFFSSKDIPGIITDTFIVRTDILESRNGDIKAVVRAWFDSIEFIESNPDEANKIMAKNLGLPVEDFKLQIKTVRFLDYNQNLEKFGTSSKLNIHELTKKAVEIYNEDGIITSEIDSNEIVDSTLLNELYS